VANAFISQVNKHTKNAFYYLKKRGCPGWGANPGPLDFIYFLIFHHFTAEPQRLPKTMHFKSNVHNSIAIIYLKTLHPGGIQTRVFCS
jgi:hypothetical protein